jgi:thioredoxin 1
MRGSVPCARAPRWRPEAKQTGEPSISNRNKQQIRTMKATIEANETNFETEVLQSDQPVVVDFWAEWCGPCKMLAPVLDEIATEQAGRAKVVKVNVDASPALAARYGIQSIPTLLYFAGDEVRHQSVGVTGKKNIVARLEALAVPAGTPAAP